MTSELWQFAEVMGVFFIAGVLWMYIIFLPGRTLERWEDQRPRHRD